MSIWDKKPKTKHAGSYGIMTDVYGSGTMDAWLEKVKAHYGPIEEKAEKWDKQGKSIASMREKWLEGIEDMKKDDKKPKELWGEYPFSLLEEYPFILSQDDYAFPLNMKTALKIKAEGERLQREGLEHHAIAVEYYEKLEAIQNWWNLFNQCIDSEVVKTKLEKILKGGA